MTFRLISLITILLAAAAANAHAQWTTQTIQLAPGWNAVFLGVRPADQEPSQVFSGLPIESVWQWNRRFNSVQFIKNADELRPADPDWLVYIPQGPEVGLTSLHAITGGKCYLIKNAGNLMVEWKVTGIPVVRRPEWIPDSLNLVGFRVGDMAQPTFATFFDASTAHRGNPIHRLKSDGSWQQESSPNTATLSTSEAFWIQTRGASTYAGPLEIILEQIDRLDFGTVLAEQRLWIKNVGAVSRTVMINTLPSAAAPQGSVASAGNVPLARWRAEFSNKIYGWEPISGETSLGLLKPGEQIVLRLAVRREDLATPTLPSGTTEAQYQSFLQVADSEKRFVSLIPVTASYTLQARRIALSARGKSDIIAKVGPGLWIGNAVIQRVSQPSAAADPDTPKATPSEAHFRLIVHVDSQGKARLLQQVLLMFKDGKDAEGNVIGPGEQVLVTDDSFINRFSGSAVRDGQLAGRRFSTVAFGFTKPLDMSGVFGSFTQPLTCGVTMDYDDPLNPFKHRFHPDHNNLTEDYKSVLPEGLESYTILREVSLTFQEKDPFDLNLRGYGTTDIGGIYQEKISGINRRPIFVEGSFRLHNASSVAVLNGGL